MGKTYLAKCSIASQSFRLRGITKEITCVWLAEEEPQEGEAATEWFLLTDLPAGTKEEAVRIIDIYTKRWTIEDYHKCYKTGCNIEKRQFQSLKTLTTVIGLLGLVAVELLRSRFLALHAPDVAIEQVIVNKQEVEFIHTLANKYLKPIDLTICKKGTVLWWTLLIARMGGHQGVRQKGMPGWQTLWNGYQYYQTLWIGYSLNKAKLFSG